MRDFCLQKDHRTTLVAAHQSIHDGGLIEIAAPDAEASSWLATQPDPLVEHSTEAVEQLAHHGLLDITGIRPARVASITEQGLLELDLAGEMG